VDAAEAEAEYGVNMVDEPGSGLYDGIIVAVAHREFAALDAAQLRALGKKDHVLYDLKNILPMGDSDLRL
jgi:UDP-N-acetyl-D-galactosamine dehydrogenase